MQQFSLDAATTLTGLEWYGVYLYATGPIGPDVFSFEIYQNLPQGGPAARAVLTRSIALLSRTDTGADMGTGHWAPDIYAYSGGFDAVSLAAGTYWAAIVNDTRAAQDVLWAQYESLEPGPNRARRLGVGAWSVATNTTAALALSGQVTPVPLPAGLPLMLGGLLAFVALRRKRSALV